MRLVCISSHRGYCEDRLPWLSLRLIPCFIILSLTSLHRGPEPLGVFHCIALCLSRTLDSIPFLSLPASSGSSVSRWQTSIRSNFFQKPLMAVVRVDLTGLHGSAVDPDRTDSHQNTLLPFCRTNRLLASSRMVSASVMRHLLRTRSPRRLQSRQLVSVPWRH